MKMKTMTLVSIGIGLVGVYYIYDFGKKQGWFGKKKPEVIPSKPQTTTTTSGAGSIPDKPQPKTSTPNTISSKNNFVVTISSGVLNVRQMPNTSSKIMSTLKKGDEIYGRASSVAGWHEVLDTKSSFPTVIGYVYSKYIKAK